MRVGRPGVGGFGLAVHPGGKSDRTASPQPSLLLAERMENVKFVQWLSAFLSPPETGATLHHGASLQGVTGMWTRTRNRAVGRS